MSLTSSEKILHQLRRCVILTHHRHGKPGGHGRECEGRGPHEGRRQHEGHGCPGGHGPHGRHGMRPMMGRAARHGQGRLLSMLGRMDGASQKDLAEALGLRPASVSELIDKLEQAELVSRRPNEGDKRSFNVFLTEQGRASAAEAEAGRREFAAELLCDFTEEEREILSNLLGRMIGRLEALAGQEGAGGPQVEEEGERGRPGGRRRGRPDDNDRQCSGPCGRGWRSM